MNDKQFSTLHEISLAKIVPVIGIARSPKWRETRQEWIRNNPRCACCQQKEKLNVHHIRPYHLFPELELDFTNFVTLCEGGPVNCHFICGHAAKSWTAYRPDVYVAINRMIKTIDYFQSKAKETR